MTEKRRATTLAEYGEKAGTLFAVAAQGGKPYEPRATDVIISPFAKCGTTWLQQMFHTLRTRGDMDFDDISRVVPWLETSPGLGIDLNADQRGEPRGYKSHHNWHTLPRGPKYIVSIRDPGDAMVSMYRFMEGWFLEPGAIPIAEFTRTIYMSDPAKGYWGHLNSWWEHRHDETVLLLSYEGMQQHPEKTIGRVAEFCGITLDDELLEITLKHTSLPFMLEYKDRFDDAMLRTLSETVADLPGGSDSAKVREGKVGGHVSELSDEILEELDTIWQTHILPVTGFASYAALEAALQRGE
ncbi:MAG: sulfotransferase domain-containing protein [Pseudomonadota bacterium]